MLQVDPAVWCRRSAGHLCHNAIWQFLMAFEAVVLLAFGIFCFDWMHNPWTKMHPLGAF